MLQITPVIKNIIIINVLFFIAQHFILVGLDFELYPFLSDYFRPYQIVTNVFSHAGFSHLLFNMLGLFFLGSMLEMRIDSKSFGIIYLLSALGGLILNEATLWMGLHDPARVLGASGAVMGVVGALAAHSPNQQIQLLFPPIPLKLKWLALIFLAFDLYGGMSREGNVAYWVHIGGMLTGFLLMKFWYLRKKSW